MIARSACGVLVAALLASVVHAQSVAESSVAGEVVLATDAGVYVAMVGSPFRVVKGTRLLATPADVAEVSPDGRYLLLSLATIPGSAAAPWYDARADVTLGAALPTSLQDCRITQTHVGRGFSPASELACVHREDSGMTSLAVIDAQTRAEIRDPWGQVLNQRFFHGLTPIAHRSDGARP